jgi:hypothetical protein
MKLKIEVEVTDAFIDEMLKHSPVGVLAISEEQRLNFIIDKYTRELKRDMANFAIKELREQADIQIKQATEQALAQAQELVIITKDETTSN